MGMPFSTLRIKVHMHKTNNDYNCRMSRNSEKYVCIIGNTIRMLPMLQNELQHKRIKSISLNCGCGLGFVSYSLRGKRWITGVENMGSYHKNSFYFLSITNKAFEGRWARITWTYYMNIRNSGTSRHVEMERLADHSLISMIRSAM